MDNNENTSAEAGGFKFVDESEVAASMQQSAPQPEPTPQEPAPQESAEQKTVSEQSQENLTFDASTDSSTGEPSNNDYSDDDLDATVLNYLSEKLGREFSSLDDLSSPQQSALDERVEAIAKFVSETGRSPQDWFAYQSLDPSEMDDFTAVRVNMAAQYPNLSNDELNTLLSSKYKLDDSIHSDEDISLSKLQLKIDSDTARRDIEQLRDEYRAPDKQVSEDQPLFDDEWVSTMKAELDNLDGIEFELSNGKKFTFGLGEDYKRSLADRNSRLDEYFDPYVSEDGRWDFDKLNMHRAVADNIETIVQSVYRQGMSDGQRGIVDRAANVNSRSPNQQGMNPQENSLSQQLREAMGGSSGLTFKV